MLPILTPAESAALDRASADHGVGVDVLMENAGRAVATIVAELAGGTYGRRIAVVCGKGNNGGDGLVAARHLERWGGRATVVLLAAPEALRGVAAVNLRRFADAGGRIRPYAAEGLERELARADFAVDAIFGTGFRGRPEGDAAAAIRSLNRSAAGVVAVDVPSGVDAETGRVQGEAVRAEATVTFGAHKPGVVFHPGASQAGEVRVVDIGFDPDLIRSDLLLVEVRDVAWLLPARAPEAHKRSTGVVLVVAGSRSMTGAPLLAAGAAYRAGAGLVTLAVPEGILPVVQGAIEEATFLPLPQTGDGSVSEEAWESLRDRMESVDAVAVGPGLTTNESTATMVRRLVCESPVPVVADADALNAFAGRIDALADRRSPLVITPHEGEFGRLTGLTTDEIAEDRIGHLRKAASELRCVVLLKGSRTSVAEPDGRVTVNPTGGPFLATGGTGDVLTGVVAAFVARGLEVADAALAGAYVHGLAGRLASGESGEGTVATDVRDRLAGAIELLRRQRPE
jgi:ADP-dependent NAD(P)H-hydrate dehydratase / NAD(P)H-hydrate epimerase